MNIIKTIDDYMLTYSYYTIYNRAIPSLLDGLKPSQRCIMEVIKNITSFEKSNTVAGKVMLILPHGDCYDTIVGLTQTDNNNIPLIVGKGSFSNRTTRDGVPASSRYTEVKVSDFGKYIVGNKEEIDLIPSYDGKAMLPVSFSPDFPLILFNGSLGIATGFATNIPQYNLKEICEQTIRVVEGKKYQHIFPDFSTGGYINCVAPKDDSSMKYTLRAKCEVEGNSILVKEIPYNTTREEIIEKIEALYKEGQLTEIKDVNDLTDKNGLLIEIELKRNVNIDEVLNKLYMLTPLQTNYSTNIGYINNNKLMYSGIEELLKNWIEVKTINIIKGTQKKLDKINKDLDIVDGLIKTKNDIKWLGEFILRTDDNVEEIIMKKYNISRTSSEYITNLGIKYFKTSYFDKKINESKKLIEEKKELENIINTNGKEELKRRLQKTIKKYGTPRKTTIKHLSLDKIDKVKVTEKFSGYVTITTKGYIYKTKTKNIKLSIGDTILGQYKTDEEGEILYFTKNGDCNKYYTDDIKTMTAKDEGYYTALDEIVGGLFINSKTKYICKVYKDGEGIRVCKEDVGSYITATKRKKLSNSLYLDAELLEVKEVGDNNIIEYVTARNINKSLNIKSMTTKKSRDSQGVLLNKTVKEYKIK